MDNGQLTLVILASVFVGALIPLLIMIAIAFYRAGKKMAEIGAQLTRILARFETISDRVEVLSRGFQGGETSIADLLASIGNLARGLERNMKIINIFSTIMASVGTAIAAFIKTRSPGEETGKAPGPEVNAVPENGPPPSPSAASPEATSAAH
ncbi:MAG: hypothetical protein PHE84_12775 [bacterium]|nr:hypothetical protein [bacterium]